jgi:hypothetical protein
MAMMVTSPSTKPAVKVVLSITEAPVPSAGDEDTWVEVSTIPRSQAMKFIAMTSDVCHKCLECGDRTHREGVPFINFATSHWEMMIEPRITYFKVVGVTTTCTHSEDRRSDLGSDTVTSQFYPLPFPYDLSTWHQQNVK